MVAVYDHGTRSIPEDCILGRLCASEESRLQTFYLHEHTQQRGDDFLARENQNRAQRNQPK